MRIKIPEEFVQELTLLGEKEQKSRDTLIHEAIKEYLARRKVTDISVAFGLWEGRYIDALAYEQALRDEWQVNASDFCYQRSD